MAGDYTYVGGLFAWYAGAWRTPSVTLTDGDFRGPLKIQTRLSRREIFNAVKGIYLSPINNWQPADFPPVLNSTYEAEDGERIYRDVEYPYTVSSATVQRIAKIELETARRQITVVAQCKVSAYAIQPPDVIQVTHPRFGWTNKNFKVVGMQLVPDTDANDAPILGVDLTLRETDANVYGWASSEELAVVAPPLTTLPDLSAVQPPTNLALASSAATSLLRADGTRISRIKVTWTAPSDQYVQSGGRIVFEYKKSADSIWLPAGSTPGTATEHYLAGVYDGVAYDVHCWAENAAGSKSTVVTVTNHTVSGALLISANASYRPLSNPLTATDAGASATVNIAAFTMRVAGTDLSINSGSITALSFSTLYYIYYVDPNFAGGSVTYYATVTKANVLSSATSFFVGSITTPPDNGADTEGNGDGGATSQVGFIWRLYFPVNATSVSGNGVVDFAANSTDQNTATYAQCRVSGDAGTNHAEIKLSGLNTPPIPDGAIVKIYVVYGISVNTLSGTGGAVVWSVQVSTTGDSGFGNVDTGIMGETKAKTVYSAIVTGQMAMDQWRWRLNADATTAQTGGTLNAQIYEAWVVIIL
jgi:hypothetical protein